MDGVGWFEYLTLRKAKARPKAGFLFFRPLSKAKRAFALTYPPNGINERSELIPTVVQTRLI